MDNRITLKEDFLNSWSIERVKIMTLEEYTNLDKDDSFCYWLESKTTHLGSIWGGSSYKFGIYKRSDVSKAVDADNRRTDGVYAWFTKYGETKEEAFESVKNIIIDIIVATVKNDLGKIDKIDLGTAYKWKIAFLYSDFKLINIFKYEALKFVAENRGFNFKKKSSVSELQNFLIELKPEDEEYFGYTDKLWKEYEDSIKTSKPASISHKQLFINWLISHELNPEIAEELESLSEEVLANGYFNKAIYDCIEFEDFYQIMFQKPIDENWENLYEHYYYFSLENYKKITGIDLQIKYAIVTIENNTEYDYFIKNNIWEGSKKNVYDTYVNKFDKGSQLAIYKRNGNQIKIGAIGTVINNPKTGFELSVNWNTDFEKFSVKVNSDPNNLDFYQIEPESGKYKINDIKNIFYSITTKQDTMKHPLNQILFGAPGTGKTYTTKKVAVEIVDGKNYNDKDRNFITERYDQLFKAKQINFTTFHQSISYEDFIEGIKPVLKSDEDEDEDNKAKKDSTIEYENKDGIFKKLCQLAEGVTGKVEVIDNFDFQNKDFYKMSLGGKHRLEKHNWSIKNNLIFLGWGGDKDFTHLNKIKDWKLFRDTFKKDFPDLGSETKYVIQAVYIFQKMKIGDIVIISKGNMIIDAIGIIESEYFFDDTKDIDNYQFRKVKWLATDMNATPDIFISKGISQQTIYQFYKEDIKIESFNENFKKETKKEEPKKYVLIIDEINRGNVSSIFGELITLLEEDKRKGILKPNKEVLEVELPYSRDKFSVPDNLYIVGTMNTADRSVESLDTALRRRFSFVEMQPNIAVLENEHSSNGIISSDGETINMIEMLKTINERIEVLLDKDHKIGHSFFLDIIDFNGLKVIFKDKIIPLLEEYFFGDFGKIGLVLGGEFIKPKANKAKFASNFTYQDESDVSSFSDKVVYEFTANESWNTKTFISIYE